MKGDETLMGSCRVTRLASGSCFDPRCPASRRARDCRSSAGPADRPTRSARRPAAGAFGAPTPPPGVPSVRRAKPVVTTRSPARTPEPSTASRSSCLVSVTRPHADGAVVLDHIHERPGRPALHRRGRHHHHLAQRVDQQLDVDELPRPELQIGVGKLALDLHRAGGRIDLVVDHHHLAAVEHASCRRRRAPRPAARPPPARG